MNYLAINLTDQLTNITSTFTNVYTNTDVAGFTWIISLSTIVFCSILITRNYRRWGVTIPILAIGMYQLGAPIGGWIVSVCIIPLIMSAIGTQTAASIITKGIKEGYDIIMDTERKERQQRHREEIQTKLEQLRTKKEIIKDPALAKEIEELDINTPWYQRQMRLLSKKTEEDEKKSERIKKQEEEKIKRTRQISEEQAEGVKRGADDKFISNILSAEIYSKVGKYKTDSKGKATKDIYTMDEAKQEYARRLNEERQSLYELLKKKNKK